MNGTSIRERPTHIDQRSTVRHWEADLVSFTNNSHIATLVDRKSRYTIILKLKRKDATSIGQVLADRFKTLPADLYKSLTWDRGIELAKHAQFTKQTGVPVYFCDPQSPRQRGRTKIPIA